MRSRDERGWVRPATAGEHFERFPDWHKQWVSKHWPSFARWSQDYLDACQQMAMRTVEKRMVERFDPARRGGKDNPRLYFAYIGLCYKREMLTWMSRQLNGKVVRTESMESFAPESFVGALLDPKPILSRESSEYREGCEKLGEAAVWAADFREFRAFVGLHCPGLLPDLDGMLRGDTVESHRRELLRRLHGDMRAGRTPKPGKFRRKAASPK